MLTDNRDLLATAALAAFARLDLGVLLVDASRRILFATPPAEALMASGDGLRRIGGRLSATAPDCEMRLRTAVATATAGDSEPNLLTLRRECGGQMSVTVSTAGGEAEPCALVLFQTPDRRLTVTEAALRETWGLTAAEARLAAALCGGDSVTAYAARKGLSQNTVRFHLKAVFAKTGAARQSDLIRLIADNPLLAAA